MDEGEDDRDRPDELDLDGDDDDEEGSWSDDGGRLLGNTLNGDALARTLVDTQTANELGLVRSEVRRLKAKVEQLEREKDDMADDFRNTTKVLLNRIKELEVEASGAQSRPGTSAIIERIEGGPPSTATRNLARPLLPPSSSRPGSSGGLGGCPQVLRIAEDEVAPSPEAETTLCGNCRRHIPSGNVLAHSVSCYRNNWHCDACDEVLPLASKDAHLEEWTDPERLLDAVSRRDMDAVQKMLGHNADLCTALHSRTGDTAMHVASRLGDVELIAFVTGHGADINPVNGQGETPLHCAAAAVPAPGGGGSSSSSSGAAAVVSPAVRLLVELGADLNALDSRGEPVLLSLARRGCAATVKYLAEMRADTEVRTKMGDTALQVAQRGSHQETVLALLSGGASLRPGTPSRSSSQGPPAVGGSPSDGDRGVSPARASRRSGSASRSAAAISDAVAGAAAGYPPRPRMKRSNSLRGAPPAAPSLSAPRPP